MARTFNYQGPSSPIAIGALPDLEPNGNPPAADRIFSSPKLTENDQQASAVHYGVVMSGVGSVDVTVWVQDKKSGNWFQTVTQTGLANFDLIEVVGVAGADLFFQFTNPAGFATITMRAESVP